MSSTNEEDEETLIDGLTYPARVAFVAYCVERCLAEARKHAAARAQLEKLPLLAEGIEMLWSVAQGGPKPDLERVRTIREHLRTYQRPLPSGEGMAYTRDVTLVFAAMTLSLGMRVLLDPEKADADLVVGAIDGPGRLVGNVYRRAADADREVALLRVALERLRAADHGAITRAVFEGIPEWERGPLDPRYAAGHVTTDSLEDE